MTATAPGSPDGLRHGQRSTYIHHHCRCQPCRDANTTYTIRRRKTPDGRAAQRAQRRALNRLAHLRRTDYLRILTEERQKEGLA